MVSDFHSKANSLQSFVFVFVPLSLSVVPEVAQVLVYITLFLGQGAHWLPVDQQLVWIYQLKKETTRQHTIILQVSSMDQVHVCTCTCVCVYMCTLYMYMYMYNVHVHVCGNATPLEINFRYINLIFTLTRVSLCSCVCLSVSSCFHLTFICGHHSTISLRDLL